MLQLDDGAARLFGNRFHKPKPAGNTSGSHVSHMTFETRIALFLLNELVSALRANDPDTFKRWLSGGVQDLGKPAVEELLLVLACPVSD